MDDLNEESILAAFRAEPPKRTSDCPDPDTLVALADQKLAEKEALRLIEHIAFCALCRQEYAEIIELLELSKLRPRFPVLQLVLTSATCAAAAAALVYGVLVVPLTQERTLAQAHVQELQRSVAELTKSDQAGAAKLLKANDRLTHDLNESESRVATLSKSEQALEQMPLPAAHWLIATDRQSVRGIGGSSAGSQEVTLLSPVNEALLTTTPTLSIKPIPGVTHYTVTLEDAETSKEVATPKPLGANKWEVKPPLAPGKTYKWAITADRGADVLTSTFARFYELSADEQKQIEDAKKSNNPLALAAIYASVGMNESAEEVLKKNPTDPVAKRWLQELKTRAAQ